MASPEVFALQRSGLNEFLFASVGVEPNGMSLSLVSVFARLGNDPWSEAGRLARLPTPDAVESLARTIAGMPASLWPLPAATTIARRLIALLPRGGAQHLPTPGPRIAGQLKIGLLLAGLGLAMGYGLFAAHGGGQLHATDTSANPSADVVPPSPGTARPGN